MKMLRIHILVSVFVALVCMSCATNNAVDTMPSTGVTQQFLGPNDPWVRAVARMATAAILPADRAPRNFAAIAYVLLPKNITTERATAACQELFFVLPMDTLMNSRGIKPSKRIPTLWVTKTDPERIDCGQLAELYDHERADTIASVAQATGRQGPVLVAWQAPPDKADGEMLMLDMSDVPADKFTDAFMLWQTHITDDPSSWGGSSWQIDKIRLVSKNFVDTYGKDTISSIKAVKDIFFK